LLVKGDIGLQSKLESFKDLMQDLINKFSS